MRIGMLAGDLDCPGSNAVVRAFARKGIQVYGWEIVAIRDGWAGLRENRAVPIGPREIDETLTRDRPLLSSSRGPVKPGDSLHGLDALVVLGGEDAVAGAAKLAADGVQVVVVPATIRNDVMATDATFGFDTAVQIAADALDRCRTTAESHERALVVEVSGRDSGWIALHAGLAGGADVIVGTERPFDLSQVLARVTRRFERGRAPIVVLAEGALPDGIPVPNGVATWLSEEISRHTGKEARAVAVSQDSGRPTAADRELGTRFGLRAADAVHAGESGVMVALRGTDLGTVPLAAAAGRKTVSPARYREVEALLG
ncbi:ATP-dependent 6-phosphofructokinase [Amycolatopsis sp. NPDC000746]|uniref:ATP-dependent 6-phosphofructokinase n=1 Tax=Amycolatopsis sp. NPDC000746 TaxID=3154270 RepID=UPI003332284F